MIHAGRNTPALINHIDRSCLSSRLRTRQGNHDHADRCVSAPILALGAGNAFSMCDADRQCQADDRTEKQQEDAPQHVSFTSSVATYQVSFASW